MSRCLMHYAQLFTEYCQKLVLTRIRILKMFLLVLRSTVSNLKNRRIYCLRVKESNLLPFMTFAKRFVSLIAGLLFIHAFGQPTYGNELNSSKVATDSL